VRTMLRRCMLSGWSLFTVVTTLAYVAELLRSSWASIRAQYAFSGTMDLVHTALIGALYYVDPDSQPKVPIAHTSGVRVGPPPFGAYAPGILLLVIECLLTAKTRTWLSGAIALGQVRAGERPELPAGPSDKSDGEASSTHSSSKYPLSSVEQSMYGSASGPAESWRAGEPAELAAGAPGCYRRRSTGLVNVERLG